MTAVTSTKRLSGTTQVISSGERKAIETAEIIAAKLGVDVEVREAMHENDRSATGFLVPDEFEAVANQFFAHPHSSARGWERAVDAQLRIVREVEHVLARNRPGDVLQQKSYARPLRNVSLLLPREKNIKVGSTNIERNFSRF